MYRGFNLTLVEIFNQDYYKQGLSLYSEYKDTVWGTLKDFVEKNGVLDGSRMQSDWFPQVDANIFISHSHKDEKQAITLAGFLFDKFKIRTFIDSCIWGYAEDMLQIIDDEYCINKSTNNYIYNKRNHSTSHVHMMLSTALLMMIDKTECLFFLNTPDSISSSDVISKTKSPWIYSEIAMSRLVRPKMPQRRQLITDRIKKTANFSNEQLEIEYDLNLAHLTDIGYNALYNWQNNRYRNACAALDGLYGLNPVDL